MDAVTRQQFLKMCLMGAGLRAEGTGQPVTLPAVKRFLRRAGVCTLAGEVPVEIAGGAGLEERSVRVALSGALVPADKGPTGRGIRLLVGDPQAPGDASGAYRLVVERDRIAVTARSGEGLLNGLRTVAQMACTGPLPQCEVTDWPDVTARSAHLCYHVVRESLAYNCPNFKALLDQIDQLAALKYNAVLLELESLFPYRKHAAIPCRIAFTRDQVRTIRDRLAAHHMEIVPLVQCLGHAYNVLVHDEYAAYREVPGTYQQYCPLNPALPGLYMEFVDEYLELFPGLKQWHIGGDESRQLARCPRCREKAAKQGVSRLYIDYVAEIARRLHERGIAPMVWSDMLEHHPEALPLVPDYLKIVYWNYDMPKWPRPYAAGLFRRRGLQVVGAPGVRFGSSGTELSVYYLEALRGLEALIPRMHGEGTSEILVTNWMKGSPHENTHYGFAYAADLCWNATTRREDFQSRYARLVFGAGDASLCRVYETLSLPLPYAEPVQNHMPDFLNRLDLSGLRFAEKWKRYTTPEREPKIIRQLQAALAAGTEAVEILRRLAPQCTRGRRQLQLLEMSARCIRAKAEFALALHEGRRLEQTGAQAALVEWRKELPRIREAWREAKESHRRSLEPTGFASSVAFLNELMFETAEYEFLATLA